jgi:hypothetical protein
MGWVELAPYFCAASKMAQDVAVQYMEMEIGSLPKHKFEQWAGSDVAQIKKTHPNKSHAMSLKCMWMTTLPPWYPCPKPK